MPSLEQLRRDILNSPPLTPADFAETLDDLLAILIRQQAEAPRDAQPERVHVEPVERHLSTAAAEIDRLARAGTRCLVAVGWRELEVLDAMVALGWEWIPARGLLCAPGAAMRVARTAEACRGENVGAVWLVCVGPEIRKAASMVLRQPPGVMIVTPFEPSAEALPDGWRWGETDGPGTVRAYRDHVDGGYCRFDADGFSEVKAAPGVRSAVEARARRLGLLTAEPAVEPVLPPGCSAGAWPTSDGKYEAFDRNDECTRGDDAGLVVWAMWERFGAFMSREDYEALAAADLREEATDRRLADAQAELARRDRQAGDRGRGIVADARKALARAGIVDPLSLDHGIDALAKRVKGAEAKAIGLEQQAQRGLEVERELADAREGWLRAERRAGDAATVLQGARDALRRAGMDGLPDDLGARIDALATERDDRVRQWVAATDALAQTTTRVRMLETRLEAERDAVETLRGELASEHEARQAVGTALATVKEQRQRLSEAAAANANEVGRLRAELADARQVRGQVLGFTVEGRRIGLVDLGPA